jgi:ribose 5-phosphate isomerase B
MPELSPKLRIALGADHAGYHIKETIRQFLENAGYPVDDLGTWSEESVDYPDYGKAVADRVAAHQDVYGIAVCGTGMGIAIAANKVPGIRAAVAHNVDTARLAREHNDANVLAMGGRVVNGVEAVEMVQAFLSATFAGGRHGRRVEKIMQIEAAERG